MKTPTRFKLQLDGQAIGYTLFRRASSGPWHVRFSVHGAQHRIALELDALPAAKTAAVAAIQRTAQATTGNNPETWRAVCETYLAEQFPDTRTSATYHLTYTTAKSNIGHLVSYIETHEPQHAQPAELLADDVSGLLQRCLNQRRKAGIVRNDQRRDISATTLDNIRRGCQAFFTWAIASKRVPWRSNPAAITAISLPTPDTRKVPPVAEDKLLKLIEAAKALDIWPALLLVLANGFRPVGTTRLKWEDVDLDARRCIIFEKTKQRQIRLTPWVCDELKGLKEARKPEEKDRIYPFHRNWLTKLTTRLMKQVFGEHTRIRLRNLRNTFLMMNFEQGTPPQFVAQMAGNSVKTIQGKYLELSHLSGKNITEIDLRPALAARAEKVTPIKQA